MHSLSQSQFEAALSAAEEASAPAEERAEMLMEIAMGLQQRPKSAAQLHDAVRLYERSLQLAPAQAVLLRARIGARMGTAWQAVPDGGAHALEQALACYTQALETLQTQGQPEEVAETELNQGLVIQSLAALGRARITDAIAAYHRALRTFTRERHAQEYAVLHNNLAICYLSMSVADERGRMREALAVQSFEAVLEVINLVDHPSEYAMIQNNLGNALQYASSSHVLENNLRALAAYDEALRVRNPRDTPLEYANTIANKANVLRGLVPEAPGASVVANGRGDPVNNFLADPLSEALALVREAQALFEANGEADKAALMAQSASEMQSELTERRAALDGHPFPQPLEQRV